MSFDQLRKRAIVVNILLILLYILYLYAVYPTESIEKIDLAIKEAGFYSPYPSGLLEGSLFSAATICFLLFYIHAWRNSRAAIYYVIAGELFQHTATIFFGEKAGLFSTHIENFLGALMQSTEVFIFTIILFFGNTQEPESWKIKFERVSAAASIAIKKYLRIILYTSLSLVNTIAFLNILEKTLNFKLEDYEPLWIVIALATPTALATYLTVVRCKSVKQALNFHALLLLAQILVAAIVGVIA